MRFVIAFAAVGTLCAVPAQADTVCEWMEFSGKVETTGVEAQQLTVEPVSTTGPKRR